LRKPPAGPARCFRHSGQQTRLIRTQELAANPAIVEVGVSRTSGNWTESVELFYSGRLNLGFERNWFTPCGTDEKWEMVGGFEEVKAFISTHPNVKCPDNSDAGMYMSVRGTLSAPGPYGHMGGSSRELTVIEVLEVREYRAADCNGRPERSGR
jgi:hypothetical protein